MSARYAPLPNPPSIPDAERELDAAFGAENDEDIDADESTPLAWPRQHRRVNLNAPGHRSRSTPMPGAYDFEREREYNYDHPPPGSPPRPSAFALPNDIGNTNGLLPTSPVHIPVPHISLFRRAIGAILPTHYTQVPGEPSRSQVVGSGLENDGVFANVTAKPGRAREIRTEDGDMHLVPEDAPKDIPPSYAAAQLDAVPPYWETTIHAPSGMIPGVDMIIDDLPSGSLWIFALNLLISFFFQLVGFLLTYLLHTSHAAKYGSRAGLGLTLIQFGFYTRSASSAPEAPDAVPPPYVGTGHPIDPSVPVPSETIPVGGMSSREWMAFIMMTLGWFILLSSAAGFWRVKHWEASIRSSNPAPITVEEVERDIVIRRNLEHAFGGSFITARERERNDSAVVQDQDSEAARFTRNLEQAGFI